MQTSTHSLAWSRIQIILPVNNPAEIAAARVVLDELKKNYSSVIVSPIDPSNLEMFWEDPNNKKRLIRDCISLITFDVNIRIGDPALDEDMQFCELVIEEEYLNMKSHQDFIWMSVHPVSPT